jgi:hypothetical protein
LKGQSFWLPLFFTPVFSTFLEQSRNFSHIPNFLGVGPQPLHGHF